MQLQTEELSNGKRHLLEYFAHPVVTGNNQMMEAGWERTAVTASHATCTYYVRAYATNSNGTAMVEERFYNYPHVIAGCICGGRGTNGRSRCCEALEKCGVEISLSTGFMMRPIGIVSGTDILCCGIEFNGTTNVAGLEEWYCHH
ncbi:MAG: hypothetical protein IPP96_17780 [Chitinophagaceae bacterium]|nr:hypothetical protein [Chitinophagaceae bacterium]